MHMQLHSTQLTQSPLSILNQSPVNAEQTINTCVLLDQSREAVEQYISSIFHATYGATVFEYLPLLCSLERHGHHSAALGLRAAQRATLFCEQYLDRPVQSYIQEQFGGEPDRSTIMELGNLVASKPGQAMFLYLLVAAALNEAGVKYLLFTANKPVMTSINRCGFSPRVLCDANPAKLGSAADKWGSYYQGKPKVVLGDIKHAIRHGRRTPWIDQLWQEHGRLIGQLADTFRATSW